MTKKFTITAIIFFLLSVFNISADNDTDDEDMDGDVLIELKENPGNPIGRPKAPSRQRINCHYTNGMLYIQFALPEGNCELTVIDTENESDQIYHFDSTTDAFINIGKLTSFEIYISTEKGNLYFGYK